MSVRSRVCLSGLLMGGIVGLPLQADEAPTSATKSGSQSGAVAVQSSATATSSQSPGFRFSDDHNAPGDSSRRRGRNTLTIGTVDSKTGQPADANQSPGVNGIQFMGEPVPPRTSDRDTFLRPSPANGTPSATAASQFRFIDDGASSVRPRSASGQPMLTINGAQESPAPSGAAQGFSFVETEPANTSERPAPGEPTPARHLQNIGPLKTVGQWQPIGPQTPPNETLPIVPGADEPADGDGVLMTILQHSDAPSLREPATHSPKQTAVPRPSSAGPSSPAGVVTVSNFEADEPRQTQQATGQYPATAPTSWADAAVSALAAPTGHTDTGERVRMTPSSNTAPTMVPDAAHIADSANYDLRRFDSSASQSPDEAPGDDAWVVTDSSAEASDTSAETPSAPVPAIDARMCAEIAAEQLLLPVGVPELPSIRSPTDEPAWLNPAPQSAPLAPPAIEVGVPYTGVTKRTDGTPVSDTDSSYTMGPARASRPLPADHIFVQPQVRSPQSAGDIHTTSIELAALLQDLEPLTPGGPQLPGEEEATTPSAADFPDTDDDASASGADNAAEQTLGEAPEETDEPLQFLRRQTVLLEPGEHQFDVGFSYLNDTSNFPVLLTDGTNVGVAQGQTRQRLLSVPLELRVGIAPYTQAFVNVPFGWSNTEAAFNGSEFTEDDGGIGDVSAGVTKQIIMGNQYYPDVLASIGFSAPTGNSSLATALDTPGTSLGQGFWTLTGSLSFIQTYDPLVFFYGLGYTFRFQNEFGDNIEIEPGDQVFYRFGAGFAVNPHVTLSAAFTGSVIGRDEVDGIEVGGSVREPMSLRLAATISRRKGSKTHGSFKLVEPYVNFGLNEDSIDSIIGISWTH